MRKPALFIPFFCFIASILFSCVDHDYDFDDDKLDKNGVFSPDGVNVPIGNIERISILHELKKQYTGENKIEVDENGTIFIDYRGEMPLEFPEFETPEFADLNTKPVKVENIQGNGTIFPGQYPLISNEEVEYDIAPPVFHNEKEELDIRVETIYFDSYPLDLTFYLSNLKINPGGEGKIILYLDFPSNFVLKDGIKRVVREVDVHQLNNDGSYTIPHVAEIKSYTYTGEDVTLFYGVDLSVTSDIYIQAHSPAFEMKLFVNNRNVVTNRLECYAKGREIVTGSIDGFSDLTNSFENTVLEFINPSLLTTITTNLTSDFTLDMELKTPEKQAVIRNLYYEKPSGNYPTERITQYYLSPFNEGNPSPGAQWKKYPLNNLFQSFIPDEIDYRIISHFDSEVTLYPEAMDIEANYLFRLPFEFSKIDLTINDVSEDLFSEDIYNDSFKYVEDNLIIEAENVDIAIGDDNMDVSISAAILDENNNELIYLNDVLQENEKISVSIENDDIGKMKDARHLKFIFHIVGTGTITQHDYIDITGVRLISNGGIHIDF
ncbi:MAG: hypothetical protein LIO93_08720 [Bacteroidales bacterium]|nr:hypothetical protein [Bacteroidales bacterium]